MVTMQLLSRIPLMENRDERRITETQQIFALISGKLAKSFLAPAPPPPPQNPVSAPELMLRRQFLMEYKNITFLKRHLNKQYCFTLSENDIVS